MSTIFEFIPLLIFWCSVCLSMGVEVASCACAACETRCIRMVVLAIKLCQWVGQGIRGISPIKFFNLNHARCPVSYHLWCLQTGECGTHVVQVSALWWCLSLLLDHSLPGQKWQDMAGLYAGSMGTTWGISLKARTTRFKKVWKGEKNSSRGVYYLTNLLASIDVFKFN